MMMTISVILTACGTPIILMITIIKAEANVQLFVCFLLLFHQVDCTKETPLCAKQNIRAYPT